MNWPLIRILSRRLYLWKMKEINSSSKNYKKIRLTAGHYITDGHPSANPALNGWRGAYFIIYTLERWVWYVCQINNCLCLLSNFATCMFLIVGSDVNISINYRWLPILVFMLYWILQANYFWQPLTSMLQWPSFQRFTSFFNITISSNKNWFITILMMIYIKI